MPLSEWGNHGGPDMIGCWWWLVSQEHLRICVFLCVLLHISMFFLDENPICFSDLCWWTLHVSGIFQHVSQVFCLMFHHVWEHLTDLTRGLRSRRLGMLTRGVADLSRNVQEISKLFVVFNMNGGWDQLYWNLWYIFLCNDWLIWLLYHLVNLYMAIEIHHL